MALKLGLVVGMEQAKQKNPKGGEWYFLPVKRERSLTAKEEEKGAAAAATGRHFGPARGFEAHLYEGLSAASLISTGRQTQKLSFSQGGPMMIDVRSLNTEMGVMLFSLFFF